MLELPDGRRREADLRHCRVAPADPEDCTPAALSCWTVAIGQAKTAGCASPGW